MYMYLSYQTNFIRPILSHSSKQEGYHRVLTRILKIGVKCCRPEKVGSFTILFYWVFPKSWSQKWKVGVTYSKSGVNENSVSGKYFYLIFLHKNICCGYSLEVPHWGTSNEYPQHMFWCRNKKNINKFHMNKAPYLELYYQLVLGWK